jgi:hypothetical protein
MNLILANTIRSEALEVYFDGLGQETSTSNETVIVTFADIRIPPRIETFAKIVRFSDLDARVAAFQVSELVEELFTRFRQKHSDAFNQVGDELVRIYAFDRVDEAIQSYFGFFLKTRAVLRDLKPSSITCILSGTEVVDNSLVLAAAKSLEIKVGIQTVRHQKRPFAIRLRDRITTPLCRLRAQASSEAAKLAVVLNNALFSLRTKPGQSKVLIVGNRRINATTAMQSWLGALSLNHEVQMLFCSRHLSQLIAELIDRGLFSKIRMESRRMSSFESRNDDLSGQRFIHELGQIRGEIPDKRLVDFFFDFLEKNLQRILETQTRPDLESSSLKSRSNSSDVVVLSCSGEHDPALLKKSGDHVQTVFCPSHLDLISGQIDRHVFADSMLFWKKCLTRAGLSWSEVELARELKVKNYIFAGGSNKVAHNFSEARNIERSCIARGFYGYFLFAAQYPDLETYFLSALQDIMAAFPKWVLLYRPHPRNKLAFRQKISATNVQYCDPGHLQPQILGCKIFLSHSSSAAIEAKLAAKPIINLRLVDRFARPNLPDGVTAVTANFRQAAIEAIRALL